MSDISKETKIYLCGHIFIRTYFEWRENFATFPADSLREDRWMKKKKKKRKRKEEKKHREYISSSDSSMKNEF